MSLSNWLLAGVAVLVVVAPLAFAWFVSGFLVHPPPDPTPIAGPDGADLAGLDPRSLHGIEFTDVAFRTSDGVDVAGWLVPASGGTADSRGAVIFVHGRGGSRQLVLAVLDELHAAGLAVLSIDTRGHGETPEPTPGAAFVTGWLDVAAGVEFLREEHGFERVGVFGASQGASSALTAAGRSKGIDVVVSQSGGTSLFGLLRGMSVLAWVPDWEISLICSIALLRMRAPWETILSPRSGPIDLVSQIAPAPILIAHGEVDVLVSVDEAHTLYAAAREPKQLWIIPGRGHEDPMEAPGYSKRVVSFLAEGLRL